MPEEKVLRLNYTKEQIENALAMIPNIVDRREMNNYYTKAEIDEMFRALNNTQETYEDGIEESEEL